MRTVRVKPKGEHYYHCMSRVVDRRMVLGEEEKEYFRGLMRRCEGFCGVRIVTYAIMGNHFHILVQVPVHEPLGEEELLGRLRGLYGREAVREIEVQWAQWRRLGQEGLVAEDQGRYQARMGDVSEFIKTLKQRFWEWYNRREGRRGTLWEERFKSVLVEGRGHPLVTMAAYIELNAVRAGVVEDPKDYRWCGYGEALGGDRSARRGLGLVTECFGRTEEWRVVSRQYRQLVFSAGEERGLDEQGRPLRGGFSRGKVAKVLEEEGELSRYELLRCRVRYFSDGAVLGSRGFVNEIFEQFRGHYFQSQRKEGARAMKGGGWGELYTVRDLKREPIQPPEQG